MLFVYAKIKEHKNILSICGTLEMYFNIVTTEIYPLRIVCPPFFSLPLSLLYYHVLKQRENYMITRNHKIANI